MANLLALITWSNRGNQIVLELNSHIAWSEEWSLLYISGIYPHFTEGYLGRIVPDILEETITEYKFSHKAKTDLVCLEYTHNMAGGTCLIVEQTCYLCKVASHYDMPVHIDGVRLFNAVSALGVDKAKLVKHADTYSLLFKQVSQIRLETQHAPDTTRSCWHGRNDSD